MIPHNNNSVSTRCTGAPVGSVGPTADYYMERADQIAQACASAMRNGDIQLANELYERGINAVMNHMWHVGLAKLVGREFSMMNSAPQE